MPIEFYLDYRSPYAYLASTQIPALGEEIHYKPIDVLEVMRLVNNRPSPECPPKARYSRLDAQRWADHLGVTFAPNMGFMQAMRQGLVDGALLSRLALAALDLGVFERMHLPLSKAVWADDQDIATEEGRAAFFDSTGCSYAALRELADADTTRQRLSAASKAAAERGVFGVPTFFVGDEQFFGNDRLAFVKKAVLAAKQIGASA